MTALQRTYKQEMEEELHSILRYWILHTPDRIQGGFFGKIDQHNHVVEGAHKGSVLHSRILWTFSAAYALTGNPGYLAVADVAAEYISHHFTDPAYGGVYWTVDASGRPADTKKQIYAQAFAVYGWSEYCLAGQSEDAKNQAIKLYRLIVEHSYDAAKRGYIEALARDWTQTGNLRLSARDANEKKSMNTHLHVLEGFASLYRIWPDAELKERIRELIHIFLDHIIDSHTGHLILFFDDDWNQRSHMHSYGHDIEAAWLIQEAAQVIDDHGLEERVREMSVKITQAAMEGLDEDGGLWYEYDVAARHMIREKHWWPQAEAMVGFYNTFQNTGEEIYLGHSYHSWQFVRQYLLDKNGGEWFWGLHEDRTIMQGEDKAGLWKCPYHNGRACIELIKRLKE